jgi:hypothetical protein
MYLGIILSIKEDIKTLAKESVGLHEMKQHKPWFDEECLDILDQREQFKMQWVRDPCQSNVDTVEPRFANLILSWRPFVTRNVRKQKLFVL